MSMILVGWGGVVHAAEVLDQQSADVSVTAPNRALEQTVVAGTDIPAVFYKSWIVIKTAIVIFLSITIIYILRLNIMLRQSKRKLEREVRERLYAEELSHENERRVRALYNVSSLPGLSFNEQIEETLKTGCSLLRTEVGRIVRIDPERNRCVVEHIVAPERHPFVEMKAMPLDKSFSGLAYRSQNSVVISDTGDSVWKRMSFQEFYQRQGAYIAMPIEVDGEVYGTIDFSSLTPRDPYFTNSDSDLISLMSRWVCVALEKQRAQQNALADKRAAMSANHAKSSFLANMSHEIRTPLTAIIGYGESLLDEGQNEQERMDASQSIIRNGEHLLNIVNDILDLSKIEANMLEIERINCSLFDVVSDLEQMLLPRAIKKGLGFIVDYRYPLPKRIYTDPVRLRQILLNLCGNAIKFTSSGYIKVIVAFDRAQDNLTIDVIDTGIGMNEDQMRKIFKDFSQADSSTNRKYGGTGLGLALSKQLAEALDGSIKVTSEPDKGSRFMLSLSCVVDTDVEYVNTLTDVSFEYSVSPRSLKDVAYSGKVLLAEDTVDNQKLIKMMLTKIGIEVQIVENGEEALATAPGQDFDLVLMDVQMPHMDGLTAVRLLREARYDKPVVALTANALRENQQVCLDSGFDDFLLKPIDRKRLFTVLDKYLHAKHDNNIESNTSVTARGKEHMISELLLEDEDYFDIVEKFVENLPGYEDQMKDALAEQEWEQMAFVCHQVKGMGGGYGYPQLTELARELETVSKKKALTDAQRLMGEISASMEQIKRGLAEYKQKTCMA